MTLLSEQLADSPAAAWPMQETSGTVMTDVSSNDRHGVYVGGVTLGAAPIAGIGDRAVSFPGDTSAYGKVVYDSGWMAPTPEFTVEALAYGVDFGADYAGVFGQAYRDGSVKGMAGVQMFTIGVLSAQTFQGTAPGTEMSVVDVINTYLTDTAYLVTLRRTTTTVDLFVDGVLVATDTATGATAQHAHDFTVGTWFAGEFPWNGRISHVAYYDTALSDARITAHGEATHGISYPPTSGVYHDPISITPVINGPISPGPVWVATGLPPGVTIDPDTGEIGGTPDDTGVWTPEITAGDYTTTLTITLTSAAPGPYTLGSWIETADTWVEITDEIRMTDAVHIRHGRNSVLDVVGPSTATFTLDNAAGTYTPGHPGSALYPHVRPNVKLTLTINGHDWFTGYVDSWTPSYPDGTDDSPRVAVSATDRFRVWSRRQLLDTHAETVQATAANMSLWRMDIDSGAVCGDVFGVRSPIRIVTPRGTFEDNLPGETAYGASGPTYATPGVTLTPGTNPQVGDTGYWEFGDSGGPVLQLPVAFELAGDAWTLAFWTEVSEYYDRSGADGWAKRYTHQLAACTDGLGWSVWLEGDVIDDGMELKLMDESGTFFGSVSADGLFALNNLIHVAIVWDGGSDMSLYCNGFLAVTDTPTTTDTTQSTVTLGGLYMPSRRRVWNHGACTISGVAYASVALDVDQIAGMGVAGRTGFSGETPAVRVPRIMTYADVSPADYTVADGVADGYGTSQATLGPLDTAGKDLLALVQETAQAEQGVFYVDFAGVAQFADRYSRGMSTTPVFDVDQERYTSGSDFAAVIEDATIVNYVTVTASDGSTGTAFDQESIDDNGIVSASETLNVDTQAQAADHAARRVACFAQPTPRIAQVTIDLLTAEDAGVYDAVMPLKIGDLIRITGLPEQSQPSTVLDGYIEGMTGVFGIDEASITFDLSPIVPAEIVLDDDDLGRLGSLGEALDVAMDADDTTATVAAGDPGFATTDLPYDIDVTGERMTVTAAAAVSGGQQVLTVTRAVDGTPAASHSVGDAVQIARTLTLGL